MTPEATELSVRQFERYRCALGAEITIGAGSARAVRLTSAAANTAGVVEARVVDCSRGGVGLQVRTFFPHTCELEVRVFDAGSGAARGAPVYEGLLRVQRVQMLDRRPTYYVGCAFGGSGPEHDRRLARLLDVARRAEGAGGTPGA